jgi:hypothetical protein
VTDAGGIGDTFINGSSSSHSAAADGSSSGGSGEPAQLFADYPDELLHFAVGACVLFTLLGVPGNFITIVALLRYTKVSSHSRTNKMINSIYSSLLLLLLLSHVIIRIMICACNLLCK